MPILAYKVVDWRMTSFPCRVIRRGGAWGVLDPEHHGVGSASTYMGNGDVWTVSLDTRVNETNPAVTIYLGRAVFDKGGSYEDRLLEVYLNPDGANWQLAGKQQQTTFTGVTTGLDLNQWYHIDIVLNRSGSTLTGYNGGEDLPDDQADISGSMANSRSGASICWQTGRS